MLIKSPSYALPSIYRYCVVEFIDYLTSAISTIPGNVVKFVGQSGHFRITAVLDEKGSRDMMAFQKSGKGRALTTAKVIHDGLFVLTLNE